MNELIKSTWLYVHVLCVLTFNVFPVRGPSPFEDNVSHLSLELINLAREFQGSSCICIPGMVAIGTCHTPGILHKSWGYEVKSLCLQLPEAGVLPCLVLDWGGMWKESGSLLLQHLQNIPDHRPGTFSGLLQTLADFSHLSLKHSIPQFYPIN